MKNNGAEGVPANLPKFEFSYIFVVSRAEITLAFEDDGQGRSSSKVMGH
jgi:hypothetical protein